MILPVSDFKSEPRSVSSDVVQGSLLGSPLYLLYDNNFLDVIRNGAPFFFADGIKNVHTFCPEALEPTISNIAILSVTEFLGEQLDDELFQ